MKQSSRGRREQPKLHMDEPVESGQTYTLEEILDEFGGWTRREEPDGTPDSGEVPVERSGEETPPPEPAGDADRAAAERAEEPVEAAVSDPDAAAENPPAGAPQRASRFHFIRLDQTSMESMLEEDGEEGSVAAEPAASPEELPEPQAGEQTAPAESTGKIWTYHSQSQPNRPVAPARASVRREKHEAPGETKIRPSRARRESQHRQATRPAREPRVEKTAPTYPSAEEAYKSVCHKTGSLVMRRRFLFLLVLVAVGLTTLCQLQVQLGNFVFTADLTAKILLGLLLAGALLAYDVLVGGVYQLLCLRPDLSTLLSVSTVVFAVDGFAQMGGGRLPYVAVLLIGLFFAMWGRVLENRAWRRSLKAVLSMDEKPLAAVMSRRAWGNRDCIFRSQGDREQYVADLSQPSAPDKVMGAYVPAVLCISLVLSLLMMFLRERNFLLSWSVMLAGAIPVAGFLTFWRPMAILAGRLLHAGAALCGWGGARELAGSCCVVVQDRDLFSGANVSMNGMKVFGEYNVSQVVGYTYAVIAQSGCGLEPVFHDVFVNQNGRSYVVDNFHSYEGGGLGAEIQGDVILVGSIGFMQLMGVRMPEGTNVRQAVYCAVNGELAAVFAIHYNPSAAVRSGLLTVLRSRRLSLLLATRDFILTPAMVRHKYKVPGDCMEYPSVEERMRLSGPYADVGGHQVALLARDSFLPLAEAVTGGRGLCSSVYAGMAVNLLGGLLGFCIAAVLAWLGAFAAASAFNLMLFVLLWTLPALLLTSIAGK